MACAARSGDKHGPGGRPQNDGRLFKHYNSQVLLADVASAGYGTETPGGDTPTDGETMEGQLELLRG